MSFFIYLFFGISHFSLLAYTFVNYCYYLGVVTRKYIQLKLSKNIPPQIIVAINIRDMSLPHRTFTGRLPQEALDREENESSETEDTDDDYDSDDDDIEIANREIVYEETDKIDGNCYIGIAYLDKPYGVYVMNGTISTRSFFDFEYSRVLAYTRNISVYYTPSSKKLDILKLHILPNGVYEVTIHTFWIGIIQRAWRKTYAERKRQILFRGSIRNQESFRNTGRYMYGTRVLPSIHGLLSGAK